LSVASVNAYLVNAFTGDVAAKNYLIAIRCPTWRTKMGKPVGD
jgi:hypothetical protein